MLEIRGDVTSREGAKFFINVITRIALFFLVIRVIRGEITHANPGILQIEFFFEHEPKVALVNHADLTNKIALRWKTVSSVKSC